MRTVRYTLAIVTALAAYVGGLCNLCEGGDLGDLLETAAQTLEETGDVADGSQAMKETHGK